LWGLGPIGGTKRTRGQALCAQSLNGKVAKPSQSKKNFKIVEKVDKAMEKGKEKWGLADNPFHVGCWRA